MNKMGFFEDWSIVLFLKENENEIRLLGFHSQFEQYDAWPIMRMCSMRVLGKKFVPSKRK
jgi:hypothetical protein